GIFPKLFLARLYVGLNLLYHIQIAISTPLRTKYLNAIVHPPGARPTLLRQPFGPVLEADNNRGVVFSPGFISVHEGSHVGKHGGRSGLAVKPAEEFNRVAAHVHGHPAAAARDVPEPG